MPSHLRRTEGARRPHRRALVRIGIEARLVAVTTLVLIGFLALAGWVLERSFRASTLAGVEQQLRLVIYSLMGAAELDAAGIRIDDLPDPRLSRPESGLYAAVQERRLERVWRSPSALTTNVEMALAPAVRGEFSFTHDLDGAVPRYQSSYSVIWEDADETELIFQVAADQAPVLAAIGQFRRILLGGLGAVTALVVLVQVLAIRWGLRPLRTMAREVKELEEGRRERLSQRYPKELTGLRQNLERFVAHEQQRRSRYRNALENLAHSLKTPLAVIRNALGEQPAGAMVAEQLDQMERTVAHQLSKATVAGPAVVSQRIPLAGLIERLIRALKIAYAPLNLTYSLNIPKDLSVRGDEADLMEIFGNLLENACKYTRTQVRVSADPRAENTLRIEDDGPGVPREIRKEVLNRGTRGDRIQSGQGIGLSVASELLKLHGGALEITASPLGGACIVLALPR